MNHSSQSTGNTMSSFWQESRHRKGQSGLRALNERRILTLIRQHQSLPKAAIAKHTGLSAQAATVIINQLEIDGLVLRGGPQRGKRGQPTIPFSLNPTGAFGIGLKIGRRSIALTLIDFCGQVRASLREQWKYPSVSVMHRFIEKAYRALLSTLSADEQQLISGIGVAMPFEIWRWSEQVEAPEGELAEWEHVDIATMLQTFTDLPVFISNDDTAACAAELWFGENESLNDYLYCFVGTFLGGGLVLNRQLHVGRHGNAGAIASLPFNGENKSSQLLDHSSLHLLEKRLKQKNIDTEFLHGRQASWPCKLPEIEAWIEATAEGLVHAAISAHAFLDLDGVVIEGALPKNIKTRLVEACRVTLDNADLRGLRLLPVIEGSVGEDARSIGSANLPLLAQYSL